MGGLVVKRATWDAPAQSGFYRQLLGPFGTILRADETGLLVNYTARVGLSRRGENDFFSDGLVNRYVFRLHGFHNLVNAFFGPASNEAREVRRAIRTEFNRRMVMVLKVLCTDRPQVESKQLLDRLVAMGYSDLNWQKPGDEALYKWLPIRLARRSYYCG